MDTWVRGRELVENRRELGSVPIDSFIKRIRQEKPARVPGTAAFLTSVLDAAPAVLLHHLERNHVMHKRVILVTILS
jgi:KUP system potassium uptake protein